MAFGAAALAYNILDGAFGEFKKIRDAMVHARVINASIGIGLSEKMRGENGFEVLLTEEALNRCYDHIVALEKELSSLGSLLAGMNAPRASASNDPNRSQLEEAVRVHQAQFRENRRRRRSLKRLPKFPTESKLNAAVIRSREAQAAILAGWFQPLSEPPQRPTQMSPLLHEATGLPPLDQDKKD